MGKTVTKLNKNKNYESFIDPSELSQFILELIQYNKQLFVEEVRAGRIGF